jgi:serine/threonine protein phosphatase PrpC
VKFSVFQVSRKGGREKNEDRMGYCYTRESGLFLLADGMGGHPEGEVAAQLALQTISALYQKEARPVVKDVTEFLSDRAHGRAPPDHPLRQREGHARHAPHHAGGGHRAGPPHATWVHCGDSRLYVVRGNELLTRTRDHSYLEQQNAGVIRMDRINRNILFTCLGSPTKPVFDVTGPVQLQQGDKILLCSDGLWGSLSDLDIVRELSGKPVPRRCPTWSKARCATAASIPTTSP